MIEALPCCEKLNHNTRYDSGRASRWVERASECRTPAEKCWEILPGSRSTVLITDMSLQHGAPGCCATYHVRSVVAGLAILDIWLPPKVCRCSLRVNAHGRRASRKARDERGSQDKRLSSVPVGAPFVGFRPARLSCCCCFVRP